MGGGGVGPGRAFCGTADGPFLEVEGAFTLLMRAGCQAARDSSSITGLPMSRAEWSCPQVRAWLSAGLVAAPIPSSGRRSRSRPARQWRQSNATARPCQASRLQRAPGGSGWEEPCRIEGGNAACSRPGCWSR
jgi:hypothetical protein